MFPRTRVSDGVMTRCKKNVKVASSLLATGGVT